MEDVAGVAAMAGVQEQRELVSSQNPGGKSMAAAVRASRAACSGLGLGVMRREPKVSQAGSHLPPETMTLKDIHSEESHGLSI